MGDEGRWLTSEMYLTIDISASLACIKSMEQFIIEILIRKEFAER